MGFDSPEGEARFEEDMLGGPTRATKSHLVPFEQAQGVEVVRENR